MWLRTSAELVRFDGVRFVLVEITVAGAQIGDSVEAICKGADGDMRIRTTTRTFIYKKGSFADYRPPAPLPDGGIRLIFESKEYEIFIGSDDFVYLIQVDGAVKMIRRGTGWIFSFLEQDNADIWVAGGGTIYVYHQGMLASVATGLAPFNPTVLKEDSKHGIYMGTSSGVFREDHGSSHLGLVSEIPTHDEVRALLQDREGNLWVGMTASGLVRSTGGRASSFKSVDGLTDSKVLSLYEDLDGSLWVGTASGLDRFRDTKLTREQQQPGGHAA